MRTYDFLQFLCKFPRNKTICSSIATLKYKHGVIFVYCSTQLASFLIKKKAPKKQKLHLYTVDPNPIVTNTNTNLGSFKSCLLSSLQGNSFISETGLQDLWRSKAPVGWPMSCGPGAGSLGDKWPLLSAERQSPARALRAGAERALGLWNPRAARRTKPGQVPAGGRARPDAGTACGRGKGAAGLRPGRSSRGLCRHRAPTAHSRAGRAASHFTLPTAPPSPPPGGIVVSAAFYNRNLQLTWLERRSGGIWVQGLSLILLTTLPALGRWGIYLPLRDLHGAPFLDQTRGRWGAPPGHRLGLEASALSDAGKGGFVCGPCFPPLHASSAPARFSLLPGTPAFEGFLGPDRWDAPEMKTFQSSLATGVGQWIALVLAGEGPALTSWRGK